MAIWKDGRISIEIASLGEIARSKLRVWMNPYVSTDLVPNQFPKVLIEILSSFF